MKEKLKTIFRGPLVIYPMLFAIFPILFLYAHNISEMTAGQIVIPMVVSVLSTLFLWAILSLILQSMSKAGLATAIFLFLFFSYGRFYELLERWDVFVPKHGHLLSVALLIFGYCVYFIKLARRDFRITTRMLNIMAVALIAINLFNIGFYQARTALSAPAQPADTKQAAAASIDPEKLKTMPDIYFIILDEYAHPDTMKEWYAYDNSLFIKSLKDKGFFIARQSETRTPHTPQIIAQVLNMEYLTGGWYWDEEKRDYVEIVSTEGDYPGDPPWSEPSYRKLAYSKVADFLKEQGYQYICFQNDLAVDRWEQYMKANADIYFNYFETADTPRVSEFQKSLWNTTMLRPFYLHLVGIQYGMSYRRGFISTLEHLKEMPSVGGPKFVFAHIMCPHVPYLFGANGEYVSPENHLNYKDRQFYLGQYIFISGVMEKVVDTLLEKSKGPPLIILQSDHGQRPHHPSIEIGKDEWRKILNALYLPGMDKAALYDSLSPVNTFRVIFNHYFNTDYELLPDD